MNVVAFDTAGPVIGVALWADGRTSSRTERIARGAEACLVPWTLALLTDAGLTRADVDGVAVTTGPGAFTGVRVGMATAAALATGLGRPLWGCDSLTPRALRVAPRVLSLLDARKGRVYASAFEAGVGTAPADVSPEDAVRWLPAPFVATGEGALVYAGLVATAGGSVAPQADDPGVATLAALAAAALGRGEGRPPHEVAPQYVRPFS